MRFDIRYRTHFDYAGDVAESQNELRACPSSHAHQQVLHYGVTTTPSSRVHTYVDYWGTRVDTFGIRAPHGELEIVAEATVETTGPTLIDVSPPAGAIRDPAFADLHREYLQRSPHADWGEAVIGIARRRAQRAGDDLWAQVFAVHEEVSSLDYVTGQTYVGVDVDEVLAAGGGVCQDFAHLEISMYRSLGIPARYVSGYLFTVSDATGEDTTEEEVEVETHAWVEVAIPEAGWFALDPTNAQEVGERHVKIGHGRDYDDVPPLRGMFSGPSEHDLDVGVTMRRLAASQQQQ